MKHARLRVARKDRARVGIIAGQAHVSPTSLGALQHSIDERGLAHLSAPAFACSLLVSPVGTCSRALDLRGPVNVVAAGRASGLLALVRAAQWMQREHLLAMLAVGSDEGAVCNGAVATLLTRAVGPWELTGWAMGPGASSRALSRSGLSDVERIYDDDGSDVVAMSGLLRLVQARHQTSALIRSVHLGVLEVAVVMERRHTNG